MAVTPAAPGRAEEWAAALMNESPILGREQIRADPRSLPLPSAARLAAGQGQYVASISLPGMLYAAFARSDQAHARITAIDPKPALAVPGARAVFCLADLKHMGARPLPVGWVLPFQHASGIDIMAGDRVRYAGEPVAVVVAESPEAAEDAAMAVSVDYEPLPAVTDVDQALKPGAPLLHPEWRENVLARSAVDTGDVDAAFADASVIVADRFRFGRAACSPMETRGAVATYDRWRDEITLVASTQCPHHVRADLASCLGRPEGSIRVVAPDVGGGFGSKDHGSGPEAVLCLLAAHMGYPVKWIEERGEHLAATGHSRGQVFDVELAADSSGLVLALRGRLLLDVGAYSSTHGIGAAICALWLLPGPYRIGNYRLEVTGVYTNKAPSGAYRGYGAPEAAFVIEGLMDRLARQLQLDPAEIRQRNLLTPAEFPYQTASGLVYDGCDLPRLLGTALDRSGYQQFRAANPLKDRDGPVREGMGIACCVLMGGFGRSRQAVSAGMHYGGYETATVRMDADGGATVLTGLPAQGQGLDSALAQVCAGRLGITAGDVRVVAGDTAVTPRSPVGPIASRGAAVGGSAVALAADKVAGDLVHAAAITLRERPSDIVLTGRFATVRGAPEEIAVSLHSLATAIKRGDFLEEGIDPALEATCTWEPPEQTYSFAVHVAGVGVDPETGLVKVLRYYTLSDCGTLINPAVVEGQITGGVVQGIGGALMEEAAYDDDGQPLATSFADYLLPTAADVPCVEAEFTETPTPRTATGARGAGELGIIGPAAAIAGAIADALGPDLKAPARIPMTPARVWKLLAGLPDVTAAATPSSACERP
jgi:carbon-monoxide dehydrogenase large subunit